MSIVPHNGNETSIPSAHNIESIEHIHSGASFLVYETDKAIFKISNSLCLFDTDINQILDLETIDIKKILEIVSKSDPYFDAVMEMSSFRVDMSDLIIISYQDKEYIYKFINKEECKHELSRIYDSDTKNNIYLSNGVRFNPLNNTLS